MSLLENSCTKDVTNKRELFLEEYIFFLNFSHNMNIMIEDWWTGKRDTANVVSSAFIQSPMQQVIEKPPILAVLKHTSL